MFHLLERFPSVYPTPQLDLIEKTKYRSNPNLISIPDAKPISEPNHNLQFNPKI